MFYVIPMQFYDMTVCWLGIFENRIRNVRRIYTGTTQPKVPIDKL